ncbi:kinesin [Strigomonas culicis]|uniref:Kinesin n=2 Tax=Strigomonas culicis TaxID=28005 RepID=S9UB33_9TRYP|nr:kinesin [Strigomonas culicis]EPY26128.1 kinesin [Strigomonas culicis]|eukprot:EPY20298.1 kinesin [Strigomonas culicis]
MSKKEGGSSFSKEVRARAEHLLQDLALQASSPAKKTSESDELTRCLVYCRLRPSNRKDFEDGGSSLVTMHGNQVILKDERHYDYDGTFGPASAQEDVFSTVAVPCIDHAFKGFCSALMCYGQTGTGKSFTMCNTHSGQEGIIPRAAHYIYQLVAQSPNRYYTIQGQFVQIYRDQLGDLMSEDGKERVDIHFDTDKGVSLTGCSTHTLSSAEEFMKFYHTGNARRVVTATAMNPESSRGHTAMVVRIASEDPNNIMAGRVRGKITFIDLAGYERFSKTGITNSNPIMKDEAKTINASLLALGGVVSSLSAGGKHIPWRNAKLTRILQDSIGGRSRTSIILTIGPSSNHLYETTNSLQFGMRAMAVKVEAKISVTVDYVKLAQKLMNMLDEKDQQISALELQIASRDAERQEVLGRYMTDRETLEERFSKDLEELTATGATEEQLRNLKEVHKVEMQNLIEQQNEELSYQDEAHEKEINRLINEQKHEEAKSLTAMRLAQERLIEDFQEKLDHAREGSNEDLVRSLQQLSDKDAVLASRANDTSRLHAHIDALTTQVRDMGGVPAPCPSFPATFLDVSQVEEMQDRLKTDLARQQEKVIDLRTQLDRMTEIVNARQGEIHHLITDNEQLRSQLHAAGIAATESNEQLQRLVAKRAEMIDASELETLRLSMQADLNEAKSERDALAEQVERLQEEKAAVQRQRNMRSRAGSRRGTELMEEMSMPREGEGESGRSLAMRAAYKRMIERLSKQLSDRDEEKVKLTTKLNAALSLLASNGIAAAHSLSLPASPMDSGPIPFIALGRDDGTLTTNEPLPATDERAAAVLVLKDAELESQGSLLDRQERQLTKTRASLERMSQVVRSMRAQMHALGADEDDAAMDLQPVEALPLEDYTALLRQLRAMNRKLVELIFTHDPSKSEQQTLETGALLEERDMQLELKDELLLEKSAMAQYMAKLGARLISQMEALGLEPCCSLPQSYEELAAVEVGQASIYEEKQRELEERLAQEQEEKERMNRLLKAVHAKRELDASILVASQARNKELEERDNYATEMIHRLSLERTQKEKVLEDAARLATKELMELQAQMKDGKLEKKVSFFDRLFGH